MNLEKLDAILLIYNDASANTLHKRIIDNEQHFLVSVQDLTKSALGDFIDYMRENNMELVQAPINGEYQLEITRKTHELVRHMVDLPNELAHELGALGYDTLANFMEKGRRKNDMITSLVKPKDVHLYVNTYESYTDTLLLEPIEDTLTKTFGLNIIRKPVNGIYVFKYIEPEEQPEPKELWFRVGVSVAVTHDSPDDWKNDTKAMFLKALKENRVSLNGDAYAPTQPEENQDFLGEEIELGFDMCYRHIKGV